MFAKGVAKLLLLPWMVLGETEEEVECKVQDVVSLRRKFVHVSFPLSVNTCRCDNIDLRIRDS